VVAEIAALISVYKYWGILAVALFEAPLMSIVIGFFAATGQLNLVLAFGILLRSFFFCLRRLHFARHVCFLLDLPGLVRVHRHLPPKCRGRPKRAAPIRAPPRIRSLVSSEAL